MKRLFNPDFNAYTANVMMLFLRVSVGLLLLNHGMPKLQKLLSDEPIQFAAVMGMSPSLSLTLAWFAEFVCAILIMIGLFTRLAALPIIITMLVIVFHIHSDKDFSDKELPLMYLITYIIILFKGPGKFSVDTFIYNKLNNKNR
ncbi:MAG: DoxX family protein [Bacteroidia bacterium]|nr:DoxX family protein [Bacteroidia bacterium]MCZ2249615.1 DoxX family protein [Bacteroidia bacterium]